MKKPVSIILSSLMLASALVSCAPAQDKLDPAITLASSDAQTKAAWLDERLDVIPDDVVIGIGSNTSYGIDMKDFEDDGYIARSMGGEVLLFGKTESGLDRAVRQYAIAADRGETDLLDIVYHEGYRVEKLTIAGRDISEFTVVYNHDRDTQMHSKTVGNAGYAADEFIRLVQKATGVKLEKSAEEVSGPMVKIDYITDGSCGENGFNYNVENGNLYINGAPDANGCANGVYYFLQYECGWVNLMYGDSDLQDSDHVEVPDGTGATVDPLFDYRQYYTILMFPLKNERANYNGIIAPASHGMQKHNWSGASGVGYQICYTNESNYSNTLDKIYTYVTEQVKSGKVIGETLTMIDISQSDYFGYCKCKDCSKVFKEEGKVHSGAVVRFANRLAADMEAEGLGGLAYQIFAYHGSNIPPVTEVRDDVYVTFCTDGACINHPLDGSGCADGVAFDMAGFLDQKEFNNEDYAAWIKGWGEKCKNLYVWHYAMTHNYGSYTYYSNLYDDFHYMSDSGVKGFFLNFDYNGLGFGRIRFQFIDAMIWNPDLTEDEFNVLRDEIMYREYGEGYHYVQDYIAILEETEYDGICYNCWGYGSTFNASNWDTEMFYSRAEECFDILEKAVALASTELQEDLIKVLSTEVLYRQCAIGYFTAYEEGDVDTIAYLEDRYQLCLEYGNDAFNVDHNGQWPEGWKPKSFTPYKTLEEEAWLHWIDERADIARLDEDAETSPMPDKWVEWYETSSADTPA